MMQKKLQCFAPVYASPVSSQLWSATTWWGCPRVYPSPPCPPEVWRISKQRQAVGEWGSARKITTNLTSVFLLLHLQMFELQTWLHSFSLCFFFRYWGETSFNPGIFSFQRRAPVGLCAIWWSCTQKWSSRFKRNTPSKTNWASLNNRFLDDV